MPAIVRFATDGWQEELERCSAKMVEKKKKHNR